MPYSNCQVCGNPMYSKNYYGTEANGVPNKEFCSSCYKGGEFHSSLRATVSNTTLPWPMFLGRGYPQ